MWLGLLFGSVFVVLGLTGSAIAWMDELDRALNPTLLRSAGHALGPPPLEAQDVLERLARDPRYAKDGKYGRYGKPSSLVLPAQAGDVYIAWFGQRQVMLDPGTKAVLGERDWDQAALSRLHLMPTLFHLHRYLVAGEAGKIVVGVAGLVLVLVALSGLVLWWPALTLAALWKAVTVRHGGSWPRFAFSLHRAGGFFATPVLLVLGFSGAYFNLPESIAPVIRLAGPVTPPFKAPGAGPTAVSIVAPAQALALAQAAFPEARLSRLGLPGARGHAYEVRLRQPSELRHGDGATRLTIDATDGRVLQVRDPLRAVGGDRLISWLFPLHSGEAFGLAGRVAITCFGIAPLVFFITGIYLWSRRRAKRTQHR